MLDSRRCSNCGCRADDHFNGTGLCDLGFCPSKCKEFVPPTE